MIAYLHKTKTGYELTICNAPCAGAEYQAGEKIAVTGKKEAISFVGRATKPA
jgi:hypothetical protein